jgi:hypothetical protein
MHYLYTDRIVNFILKEMHVIRMLSLPLGRNAEIGALDIQTFRSSILVG